VVALSAPVLALPPVVSLPDQPPEAEQLLALVEDQLSVDDPPVLTEVGLALRLTVGSTPAAFTVIAKAGREALATPSVTLITMPT
jgi:translation initiation factor 2 alpha subunit (eIF-2alpha)